MSLRTATVKTQARYWYDRDECPGCGASLRLVAGQGVGHVGPGRRHGTHDGPTVIAGSAGAVLHAKAGWMASDICDVSADQLAALCHIAAGMVRVR